MATVSYAIKRKGCASCVQPAAPVNPEEAGRQDMSFRHGPPLFRLFTVSEHNTHYGIIDNTRMAQSQYQHVSLKLKLILQTKWLYQTCSAWTEA